MKFPYCVYVVLWIDQTNVAVAFEGAAVAHATDGIDLYGQATEMCTVKLRNLKMRSFFEKIKTYPKIRIARTKFVRTVK